MVVLIGQIKCPDCHADLGRAVVYKDKPYFDDGVMLVLVGLKRCHCCGRVYHWDGQAMGVAKATAAYGNGNGKNGKLAVGTW